MRLVFNTQPNGARIVFNPVADRLIFQGIDAASVAFGETGADLSVSVAGKTIVLVGVGLGNLARTNVRFSDGSELLVGDDDPGLGGDAAGNVLTARRAGRDDQLRGLDGNDRLDGGSGDDLMFGNAGGDLLRGGDGDDDLDGGDGDDRLIAGAGDDRLDGGAGRDRLTGGGGADVFAFAATDSPAAAGRFDTVADFRPADRFDLPRLATDGVDYFESKVAADGFGAAYDEAVRVMQAHDGGAVYVFVAGGTDGWLFADFDGPDTVPDFAVKLVGRSRVDHFDAGFIV